MKLLNVFAATALLALSAPAWSGFTNGYDPGTGAGSCHGSFRTFENVPQIIPVSVDCPRQHYIEGFAVGCTCRLEGDNTPAVYCVRGSDGNKPRQSSSTFPFPLPFGSGASECNFVPAPIEV